MKNLLKYYLRKRLPIMSIVSGIMCAVIVIFVFTNDYTQLDYVNQSGVMQQVEVATNSPLGYISFFVCVLATIIPIMEFEFKMKKISVDLYYQLPIKRQKLFLTKYIVGLLELIIPIVVCYVLCLLSIMTSDHLFNMQWFFIHMLTMIALGTVLYTTFVFIYTRANSNIDGIINMIMWIFVFVPVFGMLSNFIDGISDVSFMFIYSPISSSSYLIDKMFLDKIVRNYDYDMFIVGIILFVLLSIISFVLFLIFSKKEKAEDSMQITESWFAYKTLVPLIASSTLMCLGGELLEIVLIIGIASYIMNVVQYKTFKIGIKKVLFIVGYVLVSFILGGITQM